MGFLNHEGKDYYSALPLINVKYFKSLTDGDREVWREFANKAAIKAQKVAEEIARLQEEQRKTLEKLILESQENLMEIPGVESNKKTKGIATAPIQSGRQLNDDSEGEEVVTKLPEQVHVTAEPKLESIE